MNKSIAYSIVAIAIVEFALILLIASSAMTESKFTGENSPFENATEYPFNGSTSDTINSSFPTSDYIAGRSFENIYNLPNEIDKLINPADSNDVEVEDALVVVLTKELFRIDSTKYVVSNPDQFLQRIQWAEKMKVLSLSGHRRAIFFEMVYSYWFQKMADQLQQVEKTDSEVKFNCDFNYLTRRLSENKYYVSYEISDTEKVLMNMHQGKFGYLWMKLTNKSIKFQLFIFGIAFINIFLIILAIRTLFSKKTNS